MEIVYYLLIYFYIYIYKYIYGDSSIYGVVFFYKKNLKSFKIDIKNQRHQRIRYSIVYCRLFIGPKKELSYLPVGTSGEMKISEKS